MVASQSKPFSEKTVAAFGSRFFAGDFVRAGPGVSGKLDRDASLSSLRGSDCGRRPPSGTDTRDHYGRRPASDGRYRGRAGDVEGWRDGVPRAQWDYGSRSRCAVECGHWNFGGVFAQRKNSTLLDTENDPLVDVEVCRSLGLRSIAVLPIQGWRGVNGILEVFSTAPAAFTDQHIDLLVQLAALAERARASQPHGASPAAPKLPSAIEKAQPSGLLPASDRVGDVALAVVGRRSRPFVLAVVALVSISLLGLAAN